MSKRFNEIKLEKVQAMRYCLVCAGCDPSAARKVLEHLEKLGYKLARRRENEANKATG